MTNQDLEAIKNGHITTADIPISMNRATERLNAKMIEWEEHPEHFDGLNPFAIAVFEIRQKTLKYEASQPVEVIIGTTQLWGGEYMNYYQCGACRNPIDHHDKFCRTCGRELKWE